MTKTNKDNQQTPKPYRPDKEQETYVAKNPIEPDKKYSRENFRERARSEIEEGILYYKNVLKPE